MKEVWSSFGSGVVVVLLNEVLGASRVGWWLMINQKHDSQGSKLSEKRAAVTEGRDEALGQVVEEACAGIGRRRRRRRHREIKVALVHRAAASLGTKEGKRYVSKANPAMARLLTFVK